MKFTHALWTASFALTSALAVQSGAGPRYSSPAPVGVGAADPRTPIGPRTTPGDADSVYRITQPGSYYLRRDVNGQPGKRGIEIASNGVEIDLMGFGVLGVAGSLEGIAAVPVGTSSLHDVSLENGRVVLFDLSGIDLREVQGSSVRDVCAQQNGGHGLVLGAASLVERVIAQQNALTGLEVFDGSIVTASIATQNERSGMSGIRGAIFRDCVAIDNREHGIIANEALATGCVARANDGIGLALDRGAQAQECLAVDNLGIGILATASSVLGCTAAENDEHGIFATKSVVRDNHARGNSGFGAFATGDKSRFEANHTTDNTDGLGILDRGNVAARNSSHGNARDLVTVSGNLIGTALDFAAGSITTGNGWVNFVD